MGLSGTRAVTEFNLEDFERRLRTAGSLPTSDEDPLSELARLVEASKPEPARGGAAEPTMAHGPGPVETAELRPALEEVEFRGETDAADESERADADAERDAVDHEWTRPPPKRATFGWKARVSALAIAGVAMIGAVTALKRGVPGLPAQPPFIAAAKGPVKVAPPNDQTASAGNEVGASLLKDSPKGAPVKVVSAEEQPIDLSALASTAPPAPSPAAQTPAESSGEYSVKTTVDTPIVVTQPAPPPPSQFPEPKPVRTVSLRPDGTPIPAPTAAPAEANEAANTLEAPKAPASSVPKIATVAEAVAQPSSPKLDLPTKLSGKSSARVEVAKMDTTAPGTTAEASNEPPQRTPSAKSEKSSKAAKPRVAAAEPATPSAPDQTVDSAATKSGGWAVQLAAPRSEAEAKSIMEKYNAKYASALGGLTIGVHKATVRGATIYRLRVVGLSKADAAALCARLKGDGGDCFIAR
jgi:hypothetical protein